MSVGHETTGDFVTVDVARRSQVSAEVAVHYANFLQNEQSQEDGNQIGLEGGSGAVRLRWTR